MICIQCRDQNHTYCDGGTRCDCQHRTDINGHRLLSKPDYADDAAFVEEVGNVETTDNLELLQ